MEAAEADQAVPGGRRRRLETFRLVEGSIAGKLRARALQEETTSPFNSIHLFLLCELPVLPPRSDTWQWSGWSAPEIKRMRVCSAVVILFAAAVITGCGGTYAPEEEMEVASTSSALIACTSVGCPAGYHIASYTYSASCGNSGTCSNAVDCQPNGVSFYTCGACPAGYRTQGQYCLTQCIFCGAGCWGLLNGSFCANY